jgi:hypothetical protein
MSEPVQQHPDVPELKFEGDGHVIVFADPVDEVKLAELTQAITTADEGASEAITVEMHPNGDSRQVLVTFEPPDAEVDAQTLRVALGLEDARKGDFVDDDLADDDLD